MSEKKFMRETIKIRAKESYVHVAVIVFNKKPIDFSLKKMGDKNTVTKKTLSLLRKIHGKKLSLNFFLLGSSLEEDKREELIVKAKEFTCANIFFYIDAPEEIHTFFQKQGYSYGIIESESKLSHGSVITINFFLPEENKVKAKVNKHFSTFRRSYVNNPSRNRKKKIFV